MPKLASFRVVYILLQDELLYINPKQYQVAIYFFLAECALTNYVFVFSPRADSGYGLNDIHEKILN